MGVIDSYRDNVGFPCLCTSEGNTGNSFAERLNLSPGIMPPFREHAEWNAVGKGVFNLVKSGVALHEGCHAVPLACHGQNLKEAQGFFSESFAENIGPGAKDSAVLAALEHHKGVHQGVGVVGWRNEKADYLHVAADAQHGGYSPDVCDCRQER